MKKILAGMMMVLVVVACKSVDREEMLQESLMELSAEEILIKADALMAREQYEDARIHYRFIYENFPNSLSSISALIGLADSLWKEGKYEGRIQAFHRYEDFFSRFPQAEQAEHALFMMGVTRFDQKLKPSLDQAKTREALSYFDKYLDIYPEGPHADEAREYIQRLREVLAEHEYLVAHFYFKRGALSAALKRLEYLKVNYGDTNVVADGEALEEEVNTRMREIKEETEARIRKEQKETESSPASGEKVPED